MGAALGANKALDLTGEQAAGEALDYQNKATNRANDSLLGMYNRSRADAEPYMTAGSNAINSLDKNNFMDNWQTDPGYMFRMQEGQKAINNAAAARGMGNSGATMKALTQYGQNFGANEFQNVYNRQYNRLTGLANLGSGMTGQMMGQNQAYGQGRAGLLQNQGQAQAGATMGVHNSMMNLLGQGAQLGMMGMTGMPATPKTMPGNPGAGTSTAGQWDAYMKNWG